ncbi:MAG: gluconate 2-dehydrogenase subunit 3 family protein [Polyangiaceae bacterium]
MRETADHSGRGSRKLTRRRLLETAALVALVFGGSVAAIARTQGYPRPPGLKLAVLSPWQFAVVQHAARRIAAADRESDTTIPTPDEVGVAAFVDQWTARLPGSTRRDLGRFLAYVEHIAPLAAGCTSRFTRLAPGEQDRVLASIESSSIDLLRAGFDGLRSLVFLGFYRDPRTWSIVGYDGPLVGRPPSGWR